MSAPLLQADFNAGYGKQAVLQEIQFELHPGDKLGLVGTSGTGKTTLALALMGLLPWRRGWTSGTVLFEGKDLLGMTAKEARFVLGKRLALVPQSPSSALNRALSLRTHFEEAWRAHEPRNKSELRPRLNSLLEQVHLPREDQFLLRKPLEISVGQAQRVVLALALLHRPALLIADEPTSALDPCTQAEVLSLLREANRQDGTALLYISHDLLSVLRLCNKMTVLHGGRVVESLRTAGIEDDAQHPATRALLRSLPVPANILHSYAGEQGHADEYFCASKVYAATRL